MIEPATSKAERGPKLKLGRKKVEDDGAGQKETRGTGDKYQGKKFRKKKTEGEIIGTQEEYNRKRKKKSKPRSKERFNPAAKPV